MSEANRKNGCTRGLFSHLVKLVHDCALDALRDCVASVGAYGLGSPVEVLLAVAVVKVDALAVGDDGKVVLCLGRSPSEHNVLRRAASEASKGKHWIDVHTLFQSAPILTSFTAPLT